MKTMFKNKTEILGVMLVIILAIGSLPNFFYSSNHWQAYADLQVETIFPTGGPISTSDCGPITAGNGIVWLSCNTTLYAIDSESYVVLANISEATPSANNVLLASVSGTTVYFKEGVTDISKYTLNSARDTITLFGLYDPACGNLGFKMQYDNLGFLWYGCTGTDIIERLNPNTFTPTMTSQDLTDAVGIDCDEPEAVAFDTTAGSSIGATNGIGFILCDTSETIASFRFTGNTVTLLDEESYTNGNNDSLMLDTINNRIIIGSGVAGVDTFTYSDAGIITASTQNIGGALQWSCMVQPITALSGNITSGCQNSIGTIHLFESSNSGVTLFANIAQTEIPTLSSEQGTGYNIQETIFYFSGGTNNPSWTQISGIDEDTSPDPPDGDIGGNIVGGVDCALPENENKLICRVSDSGAIGNFVIGNGTSGLTGLVCNLGVVSCADDSNPQTNGAGLLVFIASLFVIVGMFYVAMGRNAFAMPVFIWIVIILALSAFFTITGIIDPVFLILSIIAIIALAAPRLKTMFNRGTLGEGSTE